MTTEVAARQLGMKVEELEQEVETKGIRPTHLFNDEPVYNLESFGDVGVLLRTADRPEEEDRKLLQPAGAAPAGSPDRLLIPIDAIAKAHLEVDIESEFHQGREREDTDRFLTKANRDLR